MVRCLPVVLATLPALSTWPGPLREFVELLVGEPMLSLPNAVVNLPIRSGYGST